MMAASSPRWRTSMKDKYKLIPIDGQKPEDRGRFRIVALRDFGKVKKGTIGGIVDGEHNLSQTGTCWIGKNSKVVENALITGDAQVRGFSFVCDHALVFGNAMVHSSIIFDKAMVHGHAFIDYSDGISDNAEIFGNAIVNGNVAGNGKVFENAFVERTAYVAGNARLCGNAVLDQNAEIKYGKLSKTPSIGDLVYHSLGVRAINGVVRLYKRVNSDYTSEWTGFFKYPKSGWVSEPNTDPDRKNSCTSGLHFTTLWNRHFHPYPGTIFIAADIPVEDIVCVLDGKIRCRRAKIIKGIVDVEKGTIS